MCTQPGNIHLLWSSEERMVKVTIEGTGRCTKVRKNGIGGNDSV